MSSMLAIAVTIATLSVASTSSAQSREARAPIQQTDPSIVAYTTLVKHIDLDIPIDRGKVIAFGDWLIGTLEGFALGRGLSDDSLLARIHQERRELRRFASLPVQTPGREQLGHHLFGATVQLMKDVDLKLGPSPEAAPALEALDRCARSLEAETPLRWQPDNIERFLRLAGEVLTKMASGAARKQD